MSRHLDSFDFDSLLAGGLPPPHLAMCEECAARLQVLQDQQRRALSDALVDMRVDSIVSAAHGSRRRPWGGSRPGPRCAQRSAYCFSGVGITLMI